MNGIEQDAAHAATSVLGMHEQQEHLAVVRVSCREADHAVGVVDRDQQDTWRGVVGHQLLPSPAG